MNNNISYQANVTPIGDHSETKVYNGICEITFKPRYANHEKSFNHRKRKSSTELSNEFWEIKSNKRRENKTWEILGRHQVYNASINRYSLCLNENLNIAFHRNSNMLNKQTEISNKCKDRSKSVCS